MKDSERGLCGIVRIRVESVISFMAEDYMKVDTSEKMRPVLVYLIIIIIL